MKQQAASSTSCASKLSLSRIICVIFICTNIVALIVFVSNRAWFFADAPRRLLADFRCMTTHDEKECDLAVPGGKKLPTKAWYNHIEVECPPAPLHHCSRWFISFEEFEKNIMIPTAMLDPPIKHGDSIYELGCGSGAALQLLGRKFDNTLKLVGSDFAEAVIDVAKKNLPNVTLFVHDMTKRHSQFEDNTFDHVVSNGAFAMYLNRTQMVAAMKEALRVTKPGGSLVISQFVLPGGQPRKSIVAPVSPDFWRSKQDELGMDVVAVKFTYAARFAVSFRKRVPNPPVVGDG